MALESGQSTKRIDVTYLEGVNRTVGFHVAKKQEFSHIENVRCKKVGTIEKREGQEQVGNDLEVENNFGLFFFENDGEQNKGLYRE